MQKENYYYYGEVLFKVSDVVCNSVELISDRYYIVVPTFYSMVSDDECVLTHRGTKHTIKISKEDLTFEVIR